MTSPSTALRDLVHLWRAGRRDVPVHVVQGGAVRLHRVRRRRLQRADYYNIRWPKGAHLAGESVGGRWMAVGAALEAWLNGLGGDDPLKGFSVAAMRETAKKLGLQPKPRAPETELRKLLIGKAVADLKTQRDENLGAAGSKAGTPFSPPVGTRRELPGGYMVREPSGAKDGHWSYDGTKWIPNDKAPADVWAVHEHGTGFLGHVTLPTEAQHLLEETRRLGFRPVGTRLQLAGGFGVWDGNAWQVSVLRQEINGETFDTVPVGSAATVDEAKALAAKALEARPRLAKGSRRPVFGGGPKTPVYDGPRMTVKDRPRAELTVKERVEDAVAAGHISAEMGVRLLKGDVAQRLDEDPAVKATTAAFARALVVAGQAIEIAETGDEVRLRALLRRQTANTLFNVAQQAFGLRLTKGQGRDGVVDVLARHILATEGPKPIKKAAAAVSVAAAVEVVAPNAPAKKAVKSATAKKAAKAVAAEARERLRARVLFLPDGQREKGESALAALDAGDMQAFDAATAEILENLSERAALRRGEAKWAEEYKYPRDAWRDAVKDVRAAVAPKKAPAKAPAKKAAAPKAEPIAAPSPKIPVYAPPADLDKAAAKRLRARLILSHPESYSLHGSTYVLEYGDVEPLADAVGKAAAQRIAREADVENAFNRYIQMRRPDDPTLGELDDLPPVTKAEQAHYRAEAEAELQRDWATRPVAIRMRAPGLEAMLADGRYRTVHETKMSGSLGAGSPAYRKRRAEREEMLFGIPQKAPASARPVYGYMPERIERPRDTGLLSQYGDIQVVLKPSVRARTTASVGDSIDEDTLPSPLDNPSWQSFNGAAHFDGELRQSDTWFTEAQIHGGVTVDDIDEVVFNGPAPAELAKRLDAAGVRYRDVTGAPSAATTTAIPEAPGRPVGRSTVQDGDVAVWVSPEGHRVTGRVVDLGRGRRKYIDWDGGRREPLDKADRDIEYFRPGEPSIDDLSIGALREMARKLHINLHGAKRKEDIKAAILSAEPAVATTTAPKTRRFRVADEYMRIDELADLLRRRGIATLTREPAAVNVRAAESLLAAFGDPRPRIGGSSGDEDDDLDDMCLALLQAMDEFERRQSGGLTRRVKKPFNKELHPRWDGGTAGGKGGQFRPLASQILDALTEWQKGGGAKAGKKPFEGFDDAQLRKVAKARGLYEPDKSGLPKLLPRSGRDEVERRLLRDLRAKEGARTKPTGVDRKSWDTLRTLAGGERATISPGEITGLMDAIKAVNPPPFNLAKLQVTGDDNKNLYRRHLRARPRDTMPQLPTGFGEDGNAAGGKTMEQFEDYLRAKGAVFEYGKIDPRKLVASQSQLSGPKVAKMYGFMAKGWKPGGVMILARNGKLDDTAVREHITSAFQPLERLQTDHRGVLEHLRNEVTEGTRTRAETATMLEQRAARIAKRADDKRPDPNLLDMNSFYGKSASAARDLDLAAKTFREIALALRTPPPYKGEWAVVDGHHRWAGAAARSIADGGTLNVDAMFIDADIDEVLGTKDNPDGIVMGFASFEGLRTDREAA